MGRAARPTPVAEGPEAVVEAAAAILATTRAAAPRNGRGQSIKAVGVSAPGPLNPWTGTLVSPPNLGPAFKDFPIAAALEQQLDLPVYLERDTNVAALAEMTYGVARGCADFLYVTVSTGFGGAIVSRGELLLGPDGMAGEVGHLQVERDGPPCNCGGTGHVEAIASGFALARAATTAVEEGRSPFLAARAARRAPTAQDVAEGEDAGDPTCRDLMQRARDAFAAAMVGIVNVFNPTMIVVGGAIADGQGDRLRQPARDAVARGTFPVPGRRVTIVPPALGADVSLAGAWPLVESRHRDPAFRRPSARVAATA
jgi:glucokinase